MKPSREPDLPDPFKARAHAPLDQGEHDASTIRADTDPAFARELAREARRQLASRDSDLPMRARALRALERSIDRLEDIACDETADPADVIAAIRELGKIADIYKAPTGPTARQPVSIVFKIQGGGAPSAEAGQSPPLHPDAAVDTVTTGTHDGPRPDDIVIEPVSVEIARMERAAREARVAEVVPAEVGGSEGWMRAHGGRVSGALAPLRRGGRGGGR